MKAQKIRTLRRISLLLGALALVSCISGWAISAFAASPETGQLRVIHASPDAGNVDVFVDGKSVSNNLAFGTVTDYLTLPAGNHQVQIAPAGKDVNAATITQTIPVAAGSDYTIAALGTKQDGFSLQVFTDDNRVSSDATKLRVYHLSPNAGPVDIANEGKTAIPGLTYSNASDYLSVTPGARTLNVTATQAGDMLPVNETFKAGTVNSVFAIGLYKGEPALKFVNASVAGTAPQS